MIHPRSRGLLVLTGFVLIFTLALVAQKKKGDEPVVNFDPGKAVHHFYLLKNGGAMEVSAKDEKDGQTIAAIQQQLTSQAKAFEKGNFDFPDARDKSPDGIPTIKKLRKEITFEVVPMDTGGALRMLTINEQAKSAIHDFMKYQIGEHKTGDPLTLEQ